MGIAMLPFLSSATWTAAAVVAAATTAYFLVFRGKRRDGIPRRLFLPSKEIAISLCFTAGAAIAAAPGSPEMIPLSGLGALAFLVLGNCLLISRQEAAHDAREDPAAYFSGGKANPFLPEVAILLAFGLASISWWCWGGNPAVVALTVIAGLTFVLARSRHPGLDRCIQPVADGLHLLTWAVVFMA